MDALETVQPTVFERARPLPGDDLLRADVVMDRAFTVRAPVEEVWPWLVQLGKRRAGWYLPRSVERFVPTSRRAVRSVRPGLQHLDVGEVVPDWGGAHATFTVAAIDPPHTLVYRSQRGRVHLTWAIVLSATGGGAATRVHLRLRLGPVRRRWLAAVGDAVDLLTVAGLAAGLRERAERPRT